MIGLETTVWVHLIATTMMVAVIWFVQWVHYPLFRRVGPDVFVAYEVEHTNRITWIVAPLMGAELASAGGLLLLVSEPQWTPWLWCGLALVAVNWLSTALVQVPCHQRLSKAYDDDTARWLIQSNWIRTAAWTARLPIAIYLMGATS